MTAVAEKRISKAAQKRADKLFALDRLRKMLPAGSAVYTILKHKSASGMYRRIAMIAVEDGAATNISGLVSTVLDNRWCDDGSIGVSGCGMDMGYHLVYNLSRVLFPDGFIPAKAGKKYGRNGTSAKAKDKDGGYALNHAWL